MLLCMLNRRYGRIPASQGLRSHQCIYRRRLLPFGLREWREPARLRGTLHELALLMECWMWSWFELIRVPALYACFVDCTREYVQASKNKAYRSDIASVTVLNKGRRRSRILSLDKGDKQWKPSCSICIVKLDMERRRSLLIVCSHTIDEDADYFGSKAGMPSQWFNQNRS